MSLPVVDLSASMPEKAAAVERACLDTGFFYVTGHGVPASSLADLDAAARAFFALPEAVKAEIAMIHGGRAWRGFFPVGAELTAGRPDRKEGLYFGVEEPVSDRPLRGPNLFPARVPELKPAVLGYLDRMTAVAQDVLRAVAVSLSLDPEFFAAGMTRSPTVLFRIFHYPPTEPSADDWGVGEHTDYGLLTLLAQDANGGLSVRTRDGWVDAPPVPGTFVCNIGDMLDRFTGGRYRSTPHRVRNVSGNERLSYPFFLDPSWDAEVLGTTYGEYLLAKISRVFPDLFGDLGRFS